MKKGIKIKIYIRCYSRREFIGEGIYLGKEKSWKKVPHGIISESLMKFLVNGRVISETDCEWGKEKK